MPRGERFSLPLEDEVTATFERIVGRLSPPFRLVVAAALTALELSPAVTVGKPRRFSRLGLQDRHRVVAKWHGSSWPLPRDLMKLLTGLVALIFYDDPRVMHHLGYYIEDHIRQVNAEPPVPARLTQPLGIASGRRAGEAESQQDQARQDQARQVRTREAQAREAQASGDLR